MASERASRLPVNGMLLQEMSLLFSAEEQRKQSRYLFLVLQLKFLFFVRLRL